MWVEGGLENTLPVEIPLNSVRLTEHNLKHSDRCKTVVTLHTYGTNPHSMACPVPGPSPRVAARSQPCVTAAGGSPSRAEAACALAVSPIAPAFVRARGNQQACMAAGRPAVPPCRRRRVHIPPPRSPSIHPRRLLTARPLRLVALLVLADMLCFLP